MSPPKCLELNFVWVRRQYCSLPTLPYILKYLDTLSENVQKGCHKAFRQPGSLSTQPQCNNIFGFFFFNLDFSLNLNPSKLFENPKVLQNIGLQKLLAVRVRHIQYLGFVKPGGELNFLSITILLLGSFQQLVPQCNHIIMYEYLVQRRAVFLRELWKIFCKCLISIEIAKVLLDKMQN